MKTCDCCFLLGSLTCGPAPECPAAMAVTSLQNCHLHRGEMDSGVGQTRCLVVFLFQGVTFEVLCTWILRKLHGCGVSQAGEATVCMYVYMHIWWYMKLYESVRSDTLQVFRPHTPNKDTQSIPGSLLYSLALLDNARCLQSTTCHPVSHIRSNAFCHQCEVKFRHHWACLCCDHCGAWEVQGRWQKHMLWLLWIVTIVWWAVFKIKASQRQ